MVCFVLVNLVFQEPSPDRISEEPSNKTSPIKEKEPEHSPLSPPSSTSTSSSPLKLSPSSVAPPLVFSQTSPQRDSNQATMETSAFSYTFSPPAALQTPLREGETTASSSAQPNTTPSLEFIFSPPLTRSMARRRSSGLSSAGHSYARYSAFLSRTTKQVQLVAYVLLLYVFIYSEDTRKGTPHQSPSNSPISFVSPVPQPYSSPRSSRKKVVRLPVHPMNLWARKCPARPTRAAKLPHTHL